MAEARCKYYGSPTHPTVWCVDDAWFEGYDRKRPGTTTTALLKQLGFESKERLGNESLVDLITALEVAQSDPNIANKLDIDASYDFTNLLSISKLCRNYSLRLALANFEYFDNYFQDINRPRSALLLDVGYMASDYDDVIRNFYGAQLLAKKLKGRLLHVDAAFFTSPARAGDLSVEFERLIEGKRTWEAVEARDAWPLLRMPFVVKDKIVNARLEAFLQYFSTLHRRPPLELVVDSVLAAYDIKYAHPDKQEEIDGVLLDYWYQSLPSAEQAIESFKALYYYEPGTSHGFGTRNCVVACLVKHLEWAGFQVELGNGTTSDTTFKLPVQPGVRFLILLLRFLETCTTPEVKLNILVPSHGLRATMEIGIRMDGIEAFEAAFLSNDGGPSVKILRRLIFCDKQIVYDYAADKSKAKKLVEEIWVHPAPLQNREGARILYAPVVRPAFDIEKKILRLSWEFIA